MIQSLEVIDMTANELRIGNFVMFYENSKSHEIEVSYNTICNIVEFDGIYKPIPLTEKWLVRFGFELASDRIKSSQYTEYYLKKIHFATHQKIDHWVLLGGDTKIKYVHQLQNLYFALTNEELELK